MCPVAVGIMPDGPQRVIPRNEWEKELEAIAAEDFNWDGDCVKARLFVELPFWLMIPDGCISINFDKTTTLAVLHSDYVEVLNGACFLDSRLNLGYLGPNAGTATTRYFRKWIGRSCDHRKR